MAIQRFITLERLARRTGLGQDYLRGLAEAGTIPVLPTPGGMRFDESAVREALGRLAATQQRALKEVGA